MSKQKKQDKQVRPEGSDFTKHEAEALGDSVESSPSLDELLVENQNTGSKDSAAEAAFDGKVAKIAALEAEVSSLKDQYLRKLADYENFRKRMFREKDDAVKYANSQLLADLVTVLDDFDRAVHSSEQSKDFKSLHDGVDMIRKNFLGMLDRKYGLVHFDSIGTVFDPNVHEAVMSERGECAEPVIVEEFIKGYKLRDRVLRSAKVKVRMPVLDGHTDNETTVEENA
ncbi:MAG: nucleotide exchange factor GrpE [Spirochaetia bacterium]|jgi:molecular chaperone GrpE|nr:nucleotide exchange factor GrpE [Spirochaetia bacterium]